MSKSLGGSDPGPLGPEEDPYLESMTAFAVLALDRSVEGILEESRFKGGMFSPQRYQSVSLIDYYGLHLVIDLVGRLEIGGLLAETRTVAQLLEAKQFVPDFRAPLRWLLDRLAAAGIVSKEESGDEPGYRIETPLRAHRLEWLRTQALEADPDIAPTLDLMQAAADAYPKVARGEISGERFLWTSFKLWSRFLSSPNWYYDINNQVASQAAAVRLPAAGIQALEVGAGFGSGTRALLEILVQRGTPDALSFFLITEPDRFVRRRLQRSIESTYPRKPLAFANLDINRRWDEQGCEPGKFNVVFGVNVFHLARNLDFTLSEAFRTLAPGGWLVLGEGLRPFPGQPITIELTFQLLKNFVDVEMHPGRSSHGFLCPEEWQRLLEKAGFCAIEIVPDLFRLRKHCPRFCFGAICGQKPELTACGE